MTLYTVQSKQVYEDILKNGYYICDDTKSECLNDGDPYQRFYKAYDWLVEKMNQMIKNPENIKYPVWAWYKHGEEFGVPDLNTISQKDSVLLEIEIPDEDVVLTSYDRWHSVLNDSFYNHGMTDEEFDEIKQEYDKLYSQEREQAKLESWNHVFDIKNLQYIQATFWKLEECNIKRVIELIPTKDITWVLFEKEKGISDEEVFKEYPYNTIDEYIDIYIQNYIKTKELNNKINENSLDEYIKGNTIEFDKDILDDLNELKKYSKSKDIIR